MNCLQHVGRASGMPATVWYCELCRPSTAFRVRIPKGQTGVGRGHGLRSASIARAAVVKHIKETHIREAGGVYYFVGDDSR